MINFNAGDSLVENIQFIESFCVVNNGEIVEISKEDKMFEELKSKIEILFSCSRIMPAFGVSLHNETLNALEKESWVQINFGKELSVNGLPFNALLFKLEETSGINLIRNQNGIFEGRCIYLDFGKIIDLKQFVL